jgi:hypothetical protein
MKIKIEHYQALQVKINELLDKHPEIKADDCVNSMRKRWDIYWNCGGAFTNNEQYHYLNDAHIDTAIKSILNERITAQNSIVNEPYEPLDGAITEINLDDFTMRLNCNT